jgi:4-hydroxy 2-oxovalerate aldolase
MNILKESVALDVTLRDGSFSVNFEWSESSIWSIVDSVVKLGIPFIELGFHGGIGSLLQEFTQSSSTITDNFPLPLAKELSDKYPHTNFVFMIHPIALDTLDYKEIKASGITLLRFIEQKDRVQLYRNIQEAKDAGLKISLNITSASQYPTEKLIQIASDHIESISPNIVYIADTFGSFYPNDIKKIYGSISNKNLNGVKLGFHAHDNLSLAFANALSATESGVSYVDVSILGLGRGSGNLQSELWCINAIAKWNKSYDIEASISAIAEIKRYRNGIKNRSLLSLTGAVYNLSSVEIENLYKSGKERGLTADLTASLFIKNQLKGKHSEI